MKIVSVITGIGYGHAIRQAAILRELEKKGAEIVVASYANALDYFEHRYKTLEIDGPSFPEKTSKFSTLKTILMNLKLPYFYLKNFFKLRRMFKAFNPDAIICDFEPLPLYMAKPKPHFLVFNFDPLQYQNYTQEHRKKYRTQYKYVSSIYRKAKKISAPIIIPTFEPHNSRDYNFVNPILRKLPKLSQSELLEKLKLPHPPILIMFGGSHFSTDLLYKLQDILPKIKEHFIIFTYKISGESQGNITFLPFKDNFLDYLKASKAIITQAGHSTLSECLALKKPSLLFPIPHLVEQEVTADYVKKKKISLVESKDHTEEELLVILNKFITSIPELEKNLQKINIETNGAEQVATIIETALSKEPE
jgi:uncharacterized protein (TIGR00661 family)